MINFYSILLGQTQPLQPFGRSLFFWALCLMGELGIASVPSQTMIKWGSSMIEFRYFEATHEVVDMERLVKNARTSFFESYRSSPEVFDFLECKDSSDLESALKSNLIIQEVKVVGSRSAPRVAGLPKNIAKELDALNGYVKVRATLRIGAVYLSCLKSSQKDFRTKAMADYSAMPEVHIKVSGGISPSPTFRVVDQNGHTLFSTKDVTIKYFRQYTLAKWLSLDRHGLEKQAFVTAELAEPGVVRVDLSSWNVGVRRNVQRGGVRLVIFY